ncbi:hypothetical protein [Actinomadura oligospora]|uniref:hypothetical protein n=1 Tax=Actinomadura oligospora TaxID=111804 RepID=UPI0004786BBC|nr:hypothetical protein [Actinomadura oligospora]
MIGIVIVYLLVVLAMTGLLASVVFLLRFAVMSRRAQFWRPEVDGSGPASYSTPFVWARRSADAPTPDAPPHGRVPEARIPDGHVPEGRVLDGCAVEEAATDPALVGSTIG